MDMRELTHNLVHNAIRHARSLAVRVDAQTGSAVLDPGRSVYRFQPFCLTMPAVGQGSDWRSATRSLLRWPRASACCVIPGASGVRATVRLPLRQSHLMDKLRFDKWLSAARFYKTRTLASEEIAVAGVE